MNHRNRRRDEPEGRLNRRERQFVPDFEERNPGYKVNDYNSFDYNDVITHIPVQRSNHEQASYAYRTNQMIKHAFEDGHMTLPELNQHTNQMNDMSDKNAFMYAKQNLNFK